MALKIKIDLIVSLSESPRKSVENAWSPPLMQTRRRKLAWLFIKLYSSLPTAIGFARHTVTFTQGANISGSYDVKLLKNTCFLQHEAFYKCLNYSNLTGNY
ncbi:hypothetical protein C8N47_101298 [Mangrovibacterium marinum]|uniref:Uncharacterized protein n=1 Tax=Mangrovibacterium marinum TaxID=1639118 RepID=A0A2T5C6R8_9BACT|nr:hypothetical protein C8N47_101298 [Mangrovibacterium marinum]